MDLNSQRGAVVAGAMRGDVRQKISKLEADSRQLCHNLRNLEKNRAKLTNEAVVLAQELENPGFRADETEEAMYAEPADCIRVLLDAKRVHQERAESYRTGHKCYYENECCTICNCSECEDCSETAGDIEEKDLAAEASIPAVEPEGHECCYICYKNSAALSGYPEKAAATVASEIVDDFKSTGSEEKVNFRPTISSDRCEICRCELDDRKSLVPDDNFPASLKGEERCRGGMDRAECKLWPLAVLGEARNARTRGVCEGCECNLCDLRNVDGASPPCLTTSQSSRMLNDGDTIDELGVSCGDAPAKLQQICKVEKLREVLEQLKNRNHALRKMLNDCDCLNKCNVDSLAPEKRKTRREVRQESPEARGGIARSTSGLIATVKDLQVKCRTKDGMILALAEALKKLSTPDQTERILTKLTNPCTEDSPIRDMDRSALWKYLRMERVSDEDKSKPREKIRTCLLVLFFVILSQIFLHYGCPASSPLFDSSARLFAHLKEFFDRASTDFPTCFMCSVNAIKDFGEQFKTEAFRILNQVFVFLLEYANFFSSHLTYLGALFGSLSFARTVWSLGKKFLVYNKRVSCDCDLFARLREFFGPGKSLAARINCYAKSQYHFFSYLSCLALGFVASKVTRIADKWPAILWNIYDENSSLE